MKYKYTIVTTAFKPDGDYLQLGFDNPIAVGDQIYFNEVMLKVVNVIHHYQSDKYKGETHLYCIDILAPL